MANIIENIADRVTSSLGAKVNFGEKVTLDQGETMPVSLVWFGFGGGSDGADSDAAAGKGGGGGGASVPLGVYVGDALGPRFVPNLIPMLVVSIPLVYATGKSLSRIIRALKK